MPTPRSRSKAATVPFADRFGQVARVMKEVKATGLLLRAKHIRKPLIYARHLTDRNCQVLKLLGEGLTTSEIAQQLGISSGTVQNYCQDLRLSFGGGVGLKTLRQIAWLGSSASSESSRPFERARSSCLFCVKVRSFDRGFS